MPYACIFVPDFPAQAILRAEPELRDYAVVVLDGRSPVQRPIAMNEYARQKGVQTNMPKTLLEQCSSVLLRTRSHFLEAAAHEALLKTAENFSPRIEEKSADTLMMDLAGMHKLFGPPENLAGELARRLKEMGLMARIAIASNSDAALATARGKPGITVIPPGREAEVLGPLPLAVLDPPAEILETLERWGIRDFRSLAALPTAELSERLGQPGVRLQALARGNFLRPLIGSEPQPEFTEQMELEYPLEELEPLAFILNRLLGDLCSRLSAHSAAANQIDLHLDLEADAVLISGVAPGFSPAPANLKVGATTAHEKGDGAVESKYEKSIPLPVPTRDSKLLLNLLRIQLETDPPSAPILRVALKVAPASPRVAQGGLFVPLSPDPEKLEITLARIAGLVGQQNVGSPRLLDSYRPENFEMRPFAFLPPSVAPGLSPAHADLKVGAAVAHAGLKPGATFKLGQHQADTERVVLRIYRPPALASVGLKNDIPNQLSFRGIRGRVVTAGGPWRTSGYWWQSEAWNYDEWDVEIETAGSRLVGFYRIYCDRAIAKWFVRGEYD
jgi:protein ImuB